MLKLAIGSVVTGAKRVLSGMPSGQCATGACPLTSNPYVSVLYIGVLAFLVISAITGSTQGGQLGNEELTTMMNQTNAAIPPIATADEFQSKVLGADVPVLVDLWAPWCAPCRAQLPIVEQVANSAGDQAQVVKINVEEAPDLAVSLRVSSIPPLLVFKGGQEVKRFVGVQPARALTDALGL